MLEYKDKKEDSNVLFNKTDENKYQELSKKLEDQIAKTKQLEDSLNNQIKEVSVLKTQMFGVVGFLITIFAFIEGAVNFYTPILGLVKMFSIDMLAANNFNGVKLLLDALFLTLPIIFIIVTFHYASKFFKSMTQ